MKLFGKSDNADGEEAPENVDTLDDAEGAGVADGDAPASVEMAGTEAPDGALTAPARSLVAAGVSGKKKLLILAGVLGLAGLGGGGYFFLGDTTPPAPIRPIHTPMAANTAAPTPPPVPGAVPTASSVPATPAGTIAASPAATALPAAPGLPSQPATAATAPAANPAGASVSPVAGVPSPAGNVTGTANLGPPPGDEAQAVPAGQVAATPSVTPITAPAGASPAPIASAAASNVGKPMPGGNPVASTEEPPQDLPMPIDMSPPDQAPASPTTAAMAAAAANTATPANAKTSQGASAAKPSPAEMAIVQNAAVLDQLSQPAKPSARPFDPNQPAPNQADALKTVDQLLEQQAIIRPLPPSWMHVSVDHPAGGADERLNAAREALAQNNNQGALQLFSELLQKYPKDRRALMGKAVALQKLGQSDEALAAYETVLNNDPKNIEALTNMLGLLKARDPKLALDKLLELREAYPYQADITAQLGIAYGGMGQYDDALKYLDMADALNPSSAYVLYNKAVVYDRMGRSKQAGELYREILRMSAEGRLNDSLPLDAIRSRLAVLR